MKYDVLLVDDEIKYSEMLSEYIEAKSLDFTIRSALNSDIFNAELKSKRPDLILMDWEIGTDCGLQLMKTLKTNTETLAIPTIMLTGKSDIQNQITGIKEGADDYVTKPFNLEFLITKISALLRKYEYNTLINQKFINNFHFDENILQITIKGQAYTVRRKEFLIIYNLVNEPAKVFKQEELNAIASPGTHVSRRSIDTFVNNIRNQIADDLIVTVRGKGYKINEKYFK